MPLEWCISNDIERAFLKTNSDTRISLLMTGAPDFNQQTRDIALTSDQWRVDVLDFSKVRFKPWGIPVFIRSLLRSRLWYQCGGIDSWKEEFLCRVGLILGVPQVVHWIGTDVLSVKTYLRRRPQFLNIASRVFHWATAPWLVEELGQLGIRAKFVPFTGLRRKEYLSVVPPELPEHFTILTSIRQERFDLYGWPHIKKLAQDFPDVTINVLRATKVPDGQKPANVKFLGWVENPFEAYKNSTVVVRMTEHDGYSGGIQEPLALGRYAIWTYPLPNVLTARDYPMLHGHIANLLHLHRKGLLKLNEPGREFVRQNLNPDVVARNIGRELSECARSYG